MSSAQLDLLAKYTACDVSDALLKLDVPGAGFIPDIGPLKTGTTRVVAPASTVHFSPKTTSSFPNPIGDKPELKEPADKNASKIAPGTPYADLVNPETIVVLSQPEGQACAVVGGINGARMEQLGAKGILVSGRVRDLDTLNGLKIPVWSKGTSSVGAGAQTKAYAVGYPVEIGEVTVVSGDVVMLDPAENSAVVIPKDKVDAVLELIPKLVDADEKCMADVLAGGTVKEAFAKHRGQ
ncbi:Ribonuclease E inhibitor RraA/Dimethylmenaquinone methyltransferase [Lasiodiplodia theobromae]|uniref:4-hydroxy-4-methyl-2-oxoglutarate aldolase/4-carboxy-4-hydroxy-2-oxoadipate aldolase n=2 Tax=Lasiodiplodia TaxID=66739 RepID=A0A5N5DCM7_9PEZI|nr:Ribonuclease E inhibitor RraA/Dimethylmenaquinone methyltransferase [Lasiodiplodia theobromae]KAB2575435.1 4-hydroxy-4-methyl-2-oxoglutarate aldolase/4-carboxy-4-hydroxy-2-oxoadipate aldolase [Lasiodiplodia theobromae]KAF4536788.1 Ribonuclease E inhibitor RraA/Dimethylmenaquinone methyltransferase [Lasiodiplodia theobromae]KAF9635223.1 Ribonuclease E inhibitor RraA/Dimethylmenaquinone methyltransferase [Lasiodiplodia theobromae]KAK0644803.1 4-hydroxy-4-methyl-2-oxoglutarate aldolase/4-carbox